jgi:hypothetical protein
MILNPELTTEQSHKAAVSIGDTPAISADKAHIWWDKAEGNGQWLNWEGEF